ncbi:MAG: hypothetical protein LBV41_03125 [Cytophagaceae bacterium]|nr:hypothetical protein [Cytophagaceae bacterium]
MKRIILPIVLLTVVAFYCNGHISRSIASYHSDIHIEKSGEYDRITLENSFHSTVEIGLPELPVYVQSFVVPIDAKLNGVTVNGINKQKLEGVFYVYPAQPPMPVSAEYDTDDFIPPNPAVYYSNPDGQNIIMRRHGVFLIFNNISHINILI